MLSYTLDNNFKAYPVTKIHSQLHIFFSLRIIFTFFCKITTLFFRLYGYGFEIFNFCDVKIYIELCKITGRRTKLNALRMLRRIKIIRKRTPNCLAKNVHIFNIELALKIVSQHQTNNSQRTCFTAFVYFHR